MCVCSELIYFVENSSPFLSVAQPLIKNRNFDPESRTLKKLTQNDVEMEDTVETQVKGLAEQIIADDENRRAQELVRNMKLTVRIYES